MERRIEWTWPRRTLSVIIATAMVLALVLVIERPSIAGAEARTALVSTAIAQHAAQASVLDASAAQQAVAAADVLPDQTNPVIRRICSRLLALRAQFLRLRPSFIRTLLLAVINSLIAAFGGCRGISPGV